jgi:hypothetical protein
MTLRRNRLANKEFASGATGWPILPINSDLPSKLFRNLVLNENFPASTIRARARALISAIRTPVGQARLQTRHPLQKSTE